ncbi:hypothetical protein CNEO4_190022 [Clostridium neonatale]|nr:hypothetical protein CNEO4_190022 [Clostridium neonatale]CAI3581567.1 hypothetical protein CNEO3_170011 [Clostridium neonatale]CAI3724148.1 hypothetical protein CNEO2_780001 [Clostridium neonatale]
MYLYLIFLTSFILVYVYINSILENLIVYNIFYYIVLCFVIIVKYFFKTSPLLSCLLK